MEGHGETSDFHDDWELLHHGSDSPRSSVETLEGDEEIGDATGGMIKADYFSVERSSFYPDLDLSESGDLVASDNPSWIDPGSDNARFRKNTAELWSDSGSDVSVERKFGEFDGKNVEEVVGFVGSGEIEKKKIDGSDFGLEKSDFGVNSEAGLCESVKDEVDFGVTGEKGKRLGFGIDGCDIGVKSEVSLYDSMKSEVRKFGDEVIRENYEVEDDHGVMMKEEDEQKEKSDTDEEERRRRVVWWKVPFELVRYCVMRVSGPVWTFSAAAVVVGFVILGRRLYRMKHKSRALQVKVPVDDKVSGGYFSFLDFGGYLYEGFYGKVDYVSFRCIAQCCVAD